MSHKRNNGERVCNIQFGYRLCADGKHIDPDGSEQAVSLEANISEGGQRDERQWRRHDPKDYLFSLQYIFCRAGLGRNVNLAASHWYEVQLVN